jgi:hypothetical protein
MRAALLREPPASFEGWSGRYCKDLVKQGYHATTIRGELVYCRTEQVTLGAQNTRYHYRAAR